jgi:squalene-hopene/tetraprenyl-beta-curcumene cyclase
VASALQLERARLDAALARATEELLATRTLDGHWVGELSSSALSTATAVTALAIVQRAHGDRLETRSSKLGPLIERGLAWLAHHVNTDGGWGDTDKSLSNLSTTALCWAAFGVTPRGDEEYRTVVAAAERWLTERAGGIDPAVLGPAIIQRYGKDRTFSVPILTMCALAGRLGHGREAWQWVLPLPFELAACPQQWFAWLRLPVVSYALPALIAIGQARHYHRPSRNPITRLLRRLTRERTLKVLTTIQPSSGGFLEATPLTSFVVMSLAGSGKVAHSVTAKGLEFLIKSQRANGSWPIDTNLATWVTTLAVNAIADRQLPMAESPASLSNELVIGNSRSAIRDWLLAQQHCQVHRYTNAAPGGWAWTDLAGGVPDADDTAGALLALRNLGESDERSREAATLGVQWLLDLQNGDGGIPTFCRGWGTLPFDRSAPDLTAHAVRAWLAWAEDLSAALHRRIQAAIDSALGFLARAQRTDGAWIPLWFGNQFASDEENATYGTARVLPALVEAAGQTSSLSNTLARSRETRAALFGMMERGIRWLLQAQNEDGGWGAHTRGQSSVEETALATEALARLIRAEASGELSRDAPTTLPADAIRSAVLSATTWLIARVETGEWRQPSPIGFYFAKLWYYERLYPLIFTVGALKQSVRCL